MRYAFPGIAGFVRTSASALGLTDGRLLGKALSLEPLAKIQTAAGQAGNANPANRAAILAECDGWILVLKVALDAATKARAQARTELGITEPVPAPAQAIRRRPPAPLPTTPTE
jgi:hypothetical protein